MNNIDQFHQSSLTSDNSTTVFNKVNFIQEFDFQKPLFILVNQNQNLYNFNKMVPYLVYSENGNQESTIENSFILGRGSYGKVYCGVSYKNGQTSFNMVNNLIQGADKPKKYCEIMRQQKFVEQMLYAIKIHNDCNFEEIIQLGNEYSIQYKLAEKFSNSVVCLADKVYITQDISNSYSAHAIMEIGFINLFEYINIIPKIKEEEFQKIYNQILQAILNLHSLKIAHRDIKPQNIVYVHQKGWVLADFGCSIEYKNKIGEYQLAGTKVYMPKQIRDQIQAYTYKKQVQMNLFDNDIYAFVISMLQIIYKGERINQLQQMIDKQTIQDQRLQIYLKSYQQIYSHFINSNQKIEIMPELNYVEIQLQRMNDNSQDEVQKEQTFKLMLFNQYCYYQGKKQGLNLFNMIELFALSTNRHRMNENEVFVAIKQYQNMLKTQKYTDIIKLIKPDLKKWQYDSISCYLAKQGQIKLLLEACQKYQSQLVTVNYSHKIQEMELFICLGKRKEATDMVQTLIGKAYNFDDINYLKFHFLKSELLPQTQCPQLNQQAIYIEKFKHIFYKSFGFYFFFTELKWKKMVFEIDYPMEDYSASKALDTYFFIGQKLKEFDNPVASKYFQNLLGLYCLQLRINYQDNILNQLLKKGYDCYAIFMCLYYFTIILSYIKERQNQAIELYLISISYIDENMPNYPYNWLFFYHYSKLLLHLNYLKEAKEIILIAQSRLQYEDLIGRVKIQLELWSILSKQQCFLNLNKDQFKALIDSQNQAYQVYKNSNLLQYILKRIENEIEFNFVNNGQISHTIEFISLVQELFIPLLNHEEPDSKENKKTKQTLFSLVEMKCRIVKKYGNVLQLIESFNQFLIQLSNLKLLSQFQMYILRWQSQILDIQQRNISQTDNTDIIIHYSKTIQLQLVLLDMDYPKDELLSVKIMALESYIYLMKCFKASDKVLEGQRLLSFYQDNREPE